MRTWFKRYRRRILLLSVTCIFLVLTAVSGYHVVMLQKNNHAVVAFNANAQTYNNNNQADLDQLIAAQRQVDAQFDDIVRLSALLLPQPHQEINTNAQRSRAFSEQLERDLAKRDGTKQEQQSSAQEAQKQSAEAGKSDDGVNREQLNSVLNNNTQLDASMLPSQESNKTSSSSNNTPQPW